MAMFCVTELWPKRGTIDIGWVVATILMLRLMRDSHVAQGRLQRAGSFRTPTGVA